MFRSVWAAFRNDGGLLVLCLSDHSSLRLPIGRVPGLWSLHRRAQRHHSILNAKERIRRVLRWIYSGRAAWRHDTEHRWFGFLGKTRNGVLPYCQRVRRSASFVTMWGSRISRERFDLESPTFARTFLPVGSTITRDMTSQMLPVGSYRRSKMGRKMTPLTVST